MSLPPRPSDILSWKPLDAAPRQTERRRVAFLALLSVTALAQTDEQALGCASGRSEDCRQLLLAVEVKRGTDPGIEERFAPVFNKARAVFAEACDHGDASDSGCFGAGMLHAAKRPEDLARAVTFFERSCPLHSR